MADYRCGNCGGFSNHRADCVGVLGNTCRDCPHTLHLSGNGLSSKVCGKELREFIQPNDYFTKVVGNCKCVSTFSRLGVDETLKYKKEAGKKSMGSGESDAIKVEIIPETKERRHQVGSVNNLLSNTTVTTGTSTSNISHGFMGDYYSPYWTYGYPGTNTTYIYMYQIKCPKCSAMNFMQLDTIIPCKKCKSKLKATQQKYDFEVPVEL